MDNKLTLLVFKQVSPETGKPYRLVELYLTIDGMRTRMTNRCYKTLEEANAAVRDK